MPATTRSSAAAGPSSTSAAPERTTIDGNRGNDTAFMGSGHDVFTWDPGDGSDVIEGQSGYDTMDFNGASGNENFDASANGPRLRFFRDAGQHHHGHRRRGEG